MVSQTKGPNYGTCVVGMKVPTLSLVRRKVFVISLKNIKTPNFGNAKFSLEMKPSKFTLDGDENQTRTVPMFSISVFEFEPSETEIGIFVKILSGNKVEDGRYWVQLVKKVSPGKPAIWKIPNYTDFSTEIFKRCIIGDCITLHVAFKLAPSSERINGDGNDYDDDDGNDLRDDDDGY